MKGKGKCSYNLIEDYVSPALEGEEQFVILFGRDCFKMSFDMDLKLTLLNAFKCFSFIMNFCIVFYCDFLSHFYKLMNSFIDCRPF